MSSWERMGKRPIHEEEDEHWVRNDFRSYGETHYSDGYDQNQGGYFGYEDQQNQWSRNEEEDTSLKDLMKAFIQAQNVIENELEISIEVLNMKIDQNLRNDQASIQELELRLERMNEWVENQPTGQIPSYIQLNPRLLMKAFIQAQNAIDDELEISIKVLNEKIEQNLRNDQESIQELELKLERMNEWVENQPTGQITCYIQPDPRLSNNQYDQGLRYQTPYHNTNNVNAIGTQSGFNHGDEEEQNEKEKKMLLIWASVRGIGTPPMRSTERSESSFIFHQFNATHSVPVRSIDPVQPRNDLEVGLEVENQVEDEQMVQNEDETPKSTPILPTRAYEPRKEMSLDKELEELLGTEMGEVDNTINGDITLEEFEMMFDLNVDPILTNDEGEKKLEPKTEVEKETVKASNDNQKSKGIPKKLVDLLCFLTCLEKENFLQGKDGKDKEPLNFDDFTHGEPIGHGTERASMGESVSTRINGKMFQSCGKPRNDMTHGQKPA